MPRIFDNIEQSLLPALKETLGLTDRADFCVGHCCRDLIGIAKLPQDELFSALSFSKRDGEIVNQTALRLKKKLAEEFREQLAKSASVPRGSERP